MAEGNKSYIPIGALKLRETNPTSFRETRPRESKHRSKFVWVQKAEGNKAHISLCSQGQGNKSYTNIGAVRLRETYPTSF